MNACEKCGHECPEDRLCQQCGDDPMIPGDRLCIGCDAPITGEVDGDWLAAIRKATMTTKSEHTPGPWEPAITADGYEIVSVSPHMSATVAVLTARHSETGRADARLIAAAPELLAVLEALVERIEQANGWDQRNDGLTDARAAIRKATQG